MKTVRKISAGAKAPPKRKQVAVYARGSMESDRLVLSLSVQISYYSGLIQKNPEGSLPEFTQTDSSPALARNAEPSFSGCSPTARPGGSTLSSPSPSADLPSIRWISSKRGAG